MINVNEKSFHLIEIWISQSIIPGAVCVTRYLNYVPFEEENAFRFSDLKPFYPNSIFTPTQIRLHEIDDLICTWNQIFSCHTRSRSESFHNTSLSHVIKYLSMIITNIYIYFFISLNVGMMIITNDNWHSSDRITNYNSCINYLISCLENQE